MNNVQACKEKQFQILCRIDDVCRQCDIDIFLSGDTALKAYRDGELADFVSVCIDMKDVPRFIKAMERDGKYGIRGMFNYKNYDSFDIKVYDPETIDFDIKKYRARGFVGLYVTVRLIRHIPDDAKKRKQVRHIHKSYSDYRDEQNNGYRKKDYKRLKLMRMMGRMLPGETLSHRVFKQLCGMYGGETSQLYVNGANYPSNLFDEKRTVKLYDREFFIPADTETYFGRQYGFGWEDATCDLFVEDMPRFRDANHSWEEYKQYISYIDLDEYEQYEIETKKFNEEIKPSRKVVMQCYDLLERTHWRFIFWQRYYEQKDKIISLYEQSDYETLAVLLRPYLKKIMEFKTKKLAICFDDEIYEIALKTLQEKNYIDEIETLKELVPKEHHETIRIKNYRGDYV